MQIDIGINEKDRQEIATSLSRVLADTYTLYLQTHNFHWNVTGPMFQTLHLMFETQYNELALAVDQIAERVRALGHLAPGTYQEFAELSSIKETRGDIAAETMIETLVRGQEAVVKTCRSMFELVDRTHDEPTADLLTQRMQLHEKTAWMLRRPARAALIAAAAGPDQGPAPQGSSSEPRTRATMPLNVFSKHV